MSSFEHAVEFVLKNEGGFVDNPRDTGGATNYGISLRLLRMLSVETLRKCGIFKAGETLTVDDVRMLTEDQAKLVYKFVFWEAAPFEKLTYQDECSYVFDMAVHHGIHQAIKILQRALWNALGEREALGVLDDGVIGITTLAALTVPGLNEIKLALTGERAGYVRMLCEIDPSKKEFLNGWLDRCYRWGVN